VRKALVMTGAAIVALGLAAPAADAAVTERAAAAKSVPPGKYAKSLCSTFTGWQRSLSPANIPTAGITDASAGKQALSGYFAQLVASTQSAEARLKKAGIPDVDNGRKLARSFQSFLSQVSTELAGAKAKIDTADPASPDFLTTITDVTTNLSSIDSRFGDPFSKVESQDLLSAFKDQKACKGLVTIVGG